MLPAEMRRGLTGLVTVHPLLQLLISVSSITTMSAQGILPR